MPTLSPQFEDKTHKIDDSGKAVEMEVAVGNTVLFAKYSGTEIKMEGKKLLIMRESDIFAVVVNS